MPRSNSARSRLSVVERQGAAELVSPVAGAALPTASGDFRSLAYRTLDGAVHLAIFAGEPSLVRGALVRLHSECLTGDVFGSRRCDCGEQLNMALVQIAAEGHGVLVYLRGHEGRGIGLAHKLEAYCLQDNGLDTVDANRVLGLPVDSRIYDAGAAILHDLGVTQIRLMTNNPEKCKSLRAAGIDVLERVPLLTQPNADNVDYLRVKRDRMGHLLANVDSIDNVENVK